MNKYHSAMVLFISALLVRIFLLFAFDGNRISPDSVGYHTMAVNFVHGNGLSLQREAPFERSFFREPGYPVFLACVYAVVNTFHPVEYITDYNLETRQLGHYYPEIVAVKFVQSVIGALSIVLLFLIFMRISSLKKAFWASMGSALFIQLASRDLFVLRESLVFFLLLILNLVFILYLQDYRKFLYIIIIGFIIGLLVLIFQVHIVLLPMFFLLSLLHSKRFWQSLKHSLFLTGIVAVVILPNCLSAFKCYPDIRVVKTAGTSLTHEMIAYIAAIRSAAYYGLIPEDQSVFMANSEWNTSSYTQFQRSYNGYYILKADSLNDTTQEGFASTRRLINYSRNLEKSLFLYSNIGGYSEMDFVDEYGMLIGYPLRLLPRLIGLFGLFGIALYGRKYIPYLISFITYAMFFWMLGSEGRRMIILQPFFIFFAMLFVNATLLFLKKHIFKMNICL